RQRDPASVDADVIARRVRLRSKLADRGAIHGDPPLEHQLLGSTSRSDASLRQDFLQALHARLLSHVASSTGAANTRKYETQNVFVISCFRVHGCRTVFGMLDCRGIQ